MSLDTIAKSVLLETQRFLAWWSAELATYIPARLRIGHAFLHEPLVLRLGSREAALGRDSRSGRFELIERIPLRRAERRGHARPVRLRLPSDAALRLTIPLPAAALENLPQAVAFQLDRYTPFAPEQVYIAAEAGARNGDIVPVAATLVERARVADAMEIAARLGVTVASVEVEGDAGRREPADRLSVPELSRRSRGQIALIASSMLLLLALSMAALTVPFVRAEQHMTALTAQLAAARIKAERTRRIEGELEAQKREANFLADQKAKRPPAIEILLELTRLALDDTWLSSAHFSGTELQIAGLTSSASALIARFETTSMFHKAEFRSPVTPDLASGREHFVISAQVGGSRP